MDIRSQLLALSICTALASPCAAAAPLPLGDRWQVCPATSFAEFADAFLAQASVRQRFTLASVAKTQLVEGEPEPRAVTVRVSTAKAIELLEPEQRIRLGLSAVVVRVHPRPQITISKPDTDFQLTYSFVRTSCWFLAQVDDQSL